MPKYIPPQDGKMRCPWSLRSPLELQYHDSEWGRPCYDTQTLFEYLILDTFQAGLSWTIILKKREGFRAAFHGFSAEAMAAMSDAELEFVLQDPGIIRNRLKVLAARTNARVFIEQETKKSGSLADRLWGPSEGKPLINQFESHAQIPPKTALSDAIAKDLAKTGYKFCGSVTVYALLQAAGVVNDHLLACHCHPHHQA